LSQTITKSDLDTIREKAKSSLYFFTKGILGYDWLVPHIHGPVCASLEAPTIRKLIELPRGWLKTTVCTIAYPMWLSIRNPNIRILVTQNSSTNACKKLSVIRGQWENNELLRTLFPELLPNRNSRWTADSLCITRSSTFPESTYEAAGTATKVVSRHYDVIIEDDTVAPDLDELGNESLAPTHDDVQKAIGWHRTNVLPLMNNPSKDISLVVGTRWYDQDLIAWVKENEKDYVVTTRACREDEAGLPSARGKLTYPERFDDKTLQALEVALGPYMFSCLYMNTPVRSEDMLFKPSWFKFYELVPPYKSLAIYTTVDPATDPELSKSSDLDYSVVMTCGKDLLTGDIYVLDYFRERCNPGEMASAIFNHVVKYRPHVVGYENVAYQKSIQYWLTELMKQHNIWFLLQPCPRGGARGKDVAISALQPIFAAGHIYLRTWMKELQSELLTYPLGRHDDLADALSMQLQFWRVTKTKKEAKLRLHGADPLSLDSALKEIKARKMAGRDSSLIFDPIRTGSSRGIQRTAS
jgi:predicted phage terminase large subunit-like protein